MFERNFVNYLQFEKRYSPHTISGYSSDLDQFSSYIEKIYEVKDVLEINHVMIRSWLVSLMEAGLNPKSVNRKITTLKTYYKFLSRENIVRIDPMVKIQSPKVSKNLPVFVDEKSMDFLIDEIPFENDFEGQRDKLL